MTGPVKSRAPRLVPAGERVGAVALGALAVGALAIGFLAINRLAIKRARIERLSVGTLEVDPPVVRARRWGTQSE